MVERFLTYSLERGRRIQVVLMDEAGAMTRRNLLVTAIDADGRGFTARLPGRRRETHLCTADVLTAAYARGDQGELE